jgi:hypothetical protein
LASLNWRTIVAASGKVAMAVNLAGVGIGKLGNVGTSAAIANALLTA